METSHFLVARNGWVPNHPRLPVIVYRNALPVRRDLAERFEARFAANGWVPQWRDGIYDFHHYHSTAHEALGVARGSAVLALGGPKGRRLGVRAGDALVLPAGTGHCCVRASAEFLVVGAYPPGQEWDICREAPSEIHLARIAALPAPARDPILGAGGPLSGLWHPRRSSGARPHAAGATARA